MNRSKKATAFTVHKNCRMTSLATLNNPNRTKAADSGQILLENIVLEFEVRDSGIIDFYAGNILPSC